jgi:glutathione S-transferase
MATIELIGMMDSPFVRRVAIAMTSYGISFEHRPLSAYNQPEKLAEINPLLTVPVLRTKELQLIESRLILQWVDAQSTHPWRGANACWEQAAAITDFLALKTGEYYREIGLRRKSLHCATAQERLKTQINSGLNVLNSMTIFNHAQDAPVLNHSIVAIATSYRFVTDVGQALKIELASSLLLGEWCNQIERNRAFATNTPY